MKVIVYHSYYGCDTGCCGHIVELVGDEREEFYFAHPWQQDAKDFARELVRRAFGEEHVADLDWDHCVIEDGGHT
jgi:hypothetical protein